jgi:hypothetical protein
VLDERIRRAEQAVSREQAEAQGAKMDAMLSIGSTVLGALFGRKTISAGGLGRAASSARSAGRAMRQSGDVGRAEESVHSYSEQRENLLAEFESERASLQSRSDPANETFELVQVKPKRKDITIRLLALAWVPSWHNAAGTIVPAWK